MLRECADDPSAGGRGNAGNQSVQIGGTFITCLFFERIAGATGEFEIAGNLPVQLSEEGIGFSGIEILAGEQIPLSGRGIGTEITDAAVLNESALVAFEKEAAGEIQRAVERSGQPQFLRP